MTNTAEINEAKAVIGNPDVMQFLRAEAVAKVTADMNSEGSPITAKGVEHLSLFNTAQGELVRNRLNQYIAAGVFGCLMAKHGVPSMSDYTRNREIMAHNLAQIFAGRIALSEDDNLCLDDFSDEEKAEIIEYMRANYRNDVEVSLDIVRQANADVAIDLALLAEFDDYLMYDCESWLRRFAKDDRP